MLGDALNSGGAVPALWYVELVPKNKKLTQAGEQKMLQMAEGIPRNPDQAFLWRTWMDVNNPCFHLGFVLPSQLKHF